MRKFTMLCAGLALSASLSAAEKGFMHCFAFTEKPGATESDWAAFRQATDNLPKEIKGLKMVWAGKLRAPLRQFSPGDYKTAYAAPAGEKVTGTDFTSTPRTSGACMLFENEAAFQAYSAKDNAAHNKWTEAYRKVMVPGTTTFQVISQ